jgi:peptidyl-prolyl cis-trans isomerase C/peptidyl-prolyl cis-trans isomerase D
MSFAEVAQKYSEGPQASMGGDANWQTRDHLEANYYNAAIKLSVGGVSPIIQSPFGFHIIKLTGKHSWDEVDRPAVKRIVIDERRQKLFEAFMTQMRNQASVTEHLELLKD